MTHTWLDKSEYPFTSRYFEVNGQKMHYIDEGKGETLLFVHGTPSWSFEYRHLIKELKHDFRCIAIDHIGFGLSEKPEHYDYSTQNHSTTLEKFILEKGLRNITMVVHDFGGPIGLHFGVRHPDCIKRLVILNSWSWSSEGDADFIKLKKILKSPLLPFLYRYLNFSPKVILPKSYGERKISKQTLRQYTKPFANRRQRNGALAFANSLLEDQDWFEQIWNRRAAISTKPALFVWGMKDPVIKLQHLNKFISGFENFTAVKIETSGHFPQDEQPELIVEAMREFLK